MDRLTWVLLHNSDGIILYGQYWAVKGNRVKLLNARELAGFGGMYRFMDIASRGLHDDFPVRITGRVAEVSIPDVRMVMVLSDIALQSLNAVADGPLAIKPPERIPVNTGHIPI